MSDDLEQQLRRLPPRALPAAWRGPILAASRAARDEARSRGFLFACGEVLRALYPGPLPTAALAGLWLLVALFRLETPPEPPYAGAAVSVAEVRAAQAECFLLLTQLDEMNAPYRTIRGFSAPLRRPPS